MNTKVVIVLLDSPQFNSAIAGLCLLCQVPTDTPMYNKSSPLGKKHVVVKVPWPINYWAIDKDPPVKVSPTHVKSMVSSLNVCNANIKSDIASHWLPTAAALTNIN